MTVKSDNINNNASYLLNSVKIPQLHAPFIKFSNKFKNEYSNRNMRAF